MYQDLVVMYLHYLRYVFIVYMPRVSKIIIISNLYMLSLKVALKNSYFWSNAISGSFVSTVADLYSAAQLSVAPTTGVL